MIAKAVEGGIEITEWSVEEEFSRELLRVADPRYLVEGDGMVIITASNGTWVYGVTDFTEHTVRTRLLSTTPEDAE